MDSGLLEPPGLDSGLLGPPGLDSSFLGLPGLDSGLLGLLGLVLASWRFQGKILASWTLLGSFLVSWGVSWGLLGWILISWGYQAIFLKQSKRSPILYHIPPGSPLARPLPSGRATRPYSSRKTVGHLWNRSAPPPSRQRARSATAERESHQAIFLE